MAYTEVADLVSGKLREARVSEGQIGAVVNFINQEEIIGEVFLLLDNVANYSMFPQELVASIKLGTKLSVAKVVANLKQVNRIL